MSTFAVISNRKINNQFLLRLVRIRCHREGAVKGILKTTLYSFYNVFYSPKYFYKCDMSFYAISDI